MTGFRRTLFAGEDTGATVVSARLTDIPFSPFQRALNRANQFIPLIVTLLKSKQPFKPLEFFRSEHIAQDRPRGQLRIRRSQQGCELDGAEPYLDRHKACPYKLFCLLPVKHATPKQFRRQSRLSQSSFHEVTHSSLFQI